MISLHSHQRLHYLLEVTQFCFNSLIIFTSHLFKIVDEWGTPFYHMICDMSMRLFCCHHFDRPMIFREPACWHWVRLGACMNFVNLVMFWNREKMLLVTCRMICLLTSIFVTCLTSLLVVKFRIFGLVKLEKNVIALPGLLLNRKKSVVDLVEFLG